MNVDNTGIGQTSAVGLFPSGKNPALELYDLSGNVDEWCLNEYVNPDNVDVTGESRRVLRGVCAFSGAIGVTVRDKPRIEDGFNQVAQGMMHHPVGEGRGADFTAFGFVDEEVRVRAGAIMVIAQFSLKPE